jgi:hypothetical protein
MLQSLKAQSSATKCSTETKYPNIQVKVTKMHLPVDSTSHSPVLVLNIILVRQADKQNVSGDGPINSMQLATMK